MISNVHSLNVEHNRYSRWVAAVAPPWVWFVLVSCRPDPEPPPVDLHAVHGAHGLADLISGDGLGKREAVRRVLVIFA